MSDQSPYPYPSPSTTQLEQLAGAAQQASSTPPPNFTPTQPSPPANPRKRRADGSSSRGVANLTPEQLAKKRANDREAQRAIRERTRNQIDTLEARIKELESQQPFQDLQSVVRSRDAVIAENEELKRRLHNIYTLAQPQGGLNDLALATSQQSPLPMPQLAPHEQDHTDNYAYEASQALHQQHLHPDLRALQTHQQAPAAQMSSRDRRDQPNAEVFENLDNKDVMSNGFDSHQTAPIYTRLPINGPPSNALDSVLLDFLAERHQVAAQGSPHALVVGPSYPSFMIGLDPTRASQAHPMTRVVADTLGKLPSIKDVPEKMASLLVHYLFAQWQSAPTQESYERLPEWLRPTKAQLETPHPAWVDRIPWPSMRDQIIGNPDAYSLEEWVVPYTNTHSINWPYDHILCLYSPPASSSAAASNDEPTINPVFEAHLRDLNNWSIGSAFAEAFPDLVREGDMRIIDHPR